MKNILVLGGVAVVLIVGFMFLANNADAPATNDVVPFDDEEVTLEESTQPTGTTSVVQSLGDKGPSPTAEQPSLGIGGAVMGSGEMVAIHTLANTTWAWQETIYPDNRTVKPVDADDFIVTFLDSSRFSATTDCNTLSGNYYLTDDSLTFGQVAMAKMACGGETQEREFYEMLAETQGYHFSSEGNLVLRLMLDRGSVVFVPIEN